MLEPKPIKESCLRVTTDLQALTEVLQWFDQFELPPLTADFLWQCRVVLTEGFTNAVRHAHSHLPVSTAIDLEMKLFPEYLEIKVWDQGEPFDWWGKLIAISQEDCDPLEKEGGRGLMFIKQLTDEVAYNRFADRRNCLIVRKKIP
ncbi:MAG: ATP-binding protein [Coleofasciculaceae cyanobacterium SM2_1_6]|nr:ATP-binding protein [Coleofasciculaceae cyanobacterium SM2_1_6]